MPHRKILLAGESWTSTATHIKGWDQFASVTHHRGADPFIARLAGGGLDFTYMPCHEAAERFPSSAAELDAYDCIILSDIGAENRIKTHPITPSDVSHQHDIGVGNRCQSGGNPWP